MSVYTPSHIRAVRRMTAFILFVIGVSLTVGLYYVKTRAQSAKKEVSRLERLISQEEASLRVLKAEIAYLENPARLKDLSAQHLDLEPIDINNVISVSDIAIRFPLIERKEVESGEENEGGQ